MFGIFDTFEYNQIAFYFGYQKRNSAVQSKATGLSNGWNMSSDLTLGVNYDPGDWFFMSEWIQSQTRYNSNAMYVSTGYRFNKLTPYLIHSQNTVGSFPSDAIPSAASVLRANRSQKTDSVGVRWDFMKNYDCKFQYDRVKLSDNSNGFLINVPSNVALYGDTFYALSAVVDLVF
jgi:predicted porin